MNKVFQIFFVFLFSVCLYAKTPEIKTDSKYAKEWIRNIAAKAVTNDIYTCKFQDNGDMIFERDGDIRNFVFFDIKSNNEAYYYFLIDSKKEFNMDIGTVFIMNGFIIEDNILKVATTYKESYNEKVQNWFINNAIVNDDGTLIIKDDFKPFPNPVKNDLVWDNLIDIGMLE